MIGLKVKALHMWNIILAGTACGNLVSMIENAYGYPENQESIEQGKYLETVDREFTENAPRSEPASSLVT